MLISSWTWWGNNHYQHAHLLDGNRSFDQILYNGKTREEVSEISSNFLFCAFLFYCMMCIIIFLQSSDRKWIHLLPFDFKYRPFLLMRCLLLTTTHCTTFKDFFGLTSLMIYTLGYILFRKSAKLKSARSIHEYQISGCRIFKKVNLVFQLPLSK